MKVEREIRSKQYRLVVLRIMDWDERGRPSKCVIGHEDTIFDLTEDGGSREFMTAFVPADMLEPRTSVN